MANITAELVRELREKTGAGMMNCKQALSEVKGDLEAAIAWLRKKGLATAAKKAGRVAAEGLVGVAVQETKGAILEVNSETDFVARNPEFQKFVQNATELLLKKGGDLDQLKTEAYPATNRNVEEEMTHLIATIGENMSLRRSAVVRVTDGIVASYVHNAAAPNLGRIGVLVALESTGDKAQLMQFGKQVAMHIAATKPESLTIEGLPQARIDKEREIFTEQARASGRPEEVIQKMVEGRIKKFYEEAALLEQKFVLDNSITVAQATENLAKSLNTPVKIKEFICFILGEGIEKETKDFAAEVAEQLAK